MLHLTDLDELVEKINKPHVKDCVNESLIAYRAGAYKASIATIWVAVCIDIIEKIKDLHDQGDKEATQLVNTYDLNNEAKLSDKDEENIKKKLGFEQSILDIALKDFEFISLYEYKQLARLREDRNLAVHPSFQKDGKHIEQSPENVRNHLINSCNSLFTVQNPQSKKSIDELVDLIKSNNFPTKQQDVDHILRPKLEKTKGPNIRSLLIQLLKIILNKNEENKYNLNSKELSRICSAIELIYNDKEHISKKVIEEKIPKLLDQIVKTEKIKRLFILTIKLKFLNKYIKEKGINTMLLEKIKSLSGNDITQYQVLEYAMHYDNEKEFIKRIDELEFLERINVMKENPNKCFKDQVVEIFINSSSFRRSEENAEILLKYIDLLDDKDMQKIIQKGVIKNDQIYGASKMEDLIQKLCESFSHDKKYNLFNKILEENENELNTIHLIEFKKIFENTSLDACPF